jgi:hypothetical protein
VPDALTAHQQEEWKGWLATRPQDVAEVARALPPWGEYRVKQTGQLARVQSYQEGDGVAGSMFEHVTLNIVAWQEWFPLPRGVFGVKPEDLERIDA